MEDKRRSTVDSDKEILYSKAVKAGKRIYYLDVKRNRKDEMFISITESKKVVTGDELDPQVVFEKHKIFLYKEDFTKIMGALHEMIQYIEENQGLSTPYYNKEEDNNEVEGTDDHDNIKIDIDF
jgi:hypothetical protein